jgi:hypothetical protein
VRTSKRDDVVAAQVRWAIVAGYVVGVALAARGGVSDPEIIVATVVGVFLVAAFLSAGWICGGSWRD